MWHNPLSTSLPMCGFGNPKASAYLLAVMPDGFRRCRLLCARRSRRRRARPAVILDADGRWYVGPGNGLFGLVQRRARKTRSWDIDWKPERLSASFHLARSFRTDRSGRPPRAASRHPAGRARMTRIVGQIAFPRFRLQVGSRLWRRRGRNLFLRLGRRVAMSGLDRPCQPRSNLFAP